MLMVNLMVGKGAAAGFCREHHFRRPALFELVLREDFGPSVDALRP
jgi:hypothetical protein